MIPDWFAAHAGLIGATRFPALAHPRHRVSAVELTLLLMCGAAASAAVAFVRPSLGIPGHSIVLAAIPMALGVSLAPRHLAGSVMTAGALGTAWLWPVLGAGRYGAGALASLVLLGPMIDVALRRARGGWRVYAALVSAAVATNLLALGSRAAAKLIGLDLAGARPWDSWGVQAAVTYPLCGVVAGLLGALCWFQFNDGTRNGGSRA